MQACYFTSRCLTPEAAQSSAVAAPAWLDAERPDGQSPAAAVMQMPAPSALGQACTGLCALHTQQEAAAHAGVYEQLVRELRSVR